MQLSCFTHPVGTRPLRDYFIDTSTGYPASSHAGKPAEK